MSGLGGLVEGFFSRKLERGSKDAIAIREHGRQTRHWMKLGDVQFERMLERDKSELC